MTHLLNVPFIGRLHPAIVHLPIGILLLALLLELLSRREKYRDLRQALPTILLIGACSAVLSGITGYLLSQDGGYDATVLGRHKWAGIACGVLSILAYAGRTERLRSLFDPRLSTTVSILLGALIIFTGHLGGTLTHGSAYLTEGAPPLLKRILGADADTVVKKPVTDVQDALAYGELVSPVLQQRCVSCHGPEKQKGGLRLDSPEFILKGGKNGKVLAMNQPTASELYKRLTLPLDDEHHMPPKEKSQPGSQEIALLHWWIGNGMDFSKKVRELPQEDSVRRMLTAFQSHADNASSKEATLLPEEDVPMAPATAIAALEKAGVTVLPIDPRRHYLQVNLINCSLPADSILRMLSPLREQLIWLKASGKDLTDAGMASVASCRRLRRLYLDNTKITDGGLMALKTLSDLQYLNLNGTRITIRGVQSLRDLKNLKSVYLFGTDARASEIAGISGEFPGTRLDTGGYGLPFLASDTMEKKADALPK